MILRLIIEYIVPIIILIFVIKINNEIRKNQDKNRENYDELQCNPERKER